MLPYILLRRKHRKKSLFVGLVIAISIFANFRQRPDNPWPISDEGINGLNDVKNVFIASILWNSETTLQHWIPELLELVHKLHASGTKVYVSIYESGSWDGTKAILLELDSSLLELKVNRTIILDTETHNDSITKGSWENGWLNTQYGQELRRIVYLSKLRNKVLEPLPGLTSNGVFFDRLVYLNDVIFNAGKPRPLAPPVLICARRLRS